MYKRECPYCGQEKTIKVVVGGQIYYRCLNCERTFNEEEEIND